MVHLKDTVNGIDVSTICAMDTGRWETCLFFPNGDSEVVRTYADSRDANLGHETICATLRALGEAKHWV